MTSGRNIGRNVVKPLVVAIALALPGAAAFAASMDDVVKTRADQNIDEQYGRDSVYAFSRDAKPLKPEQQASHGTGFIGDVFHKTTGFMAGAWHKTTSLFSHDGKSYSANQRQLDPQRYGRAGGYAGSERVEVIAARADTMRAAKEDTVKNGEAMDDAAASAATSAPGPSSQDQTLSRDQTMSPDQTLSHDQVMSQDQPMSHDAPTSAAVERHDSAQSNPEQARGAVDYTPQPPPVDEPNSTLNRDESQSMITAPENRQNATEPSDSAAASDETPLQPQEQSDPAQSDVVHSSTMPSSDNGRADSADSRGDASAETR